MRTPTRDRNRVSVGDLVGEQTVGKSVGEAVGEAVGETVGEAVHSQRSCFTCAACAVDSSSPALAHAASAVFFCRCSARSDRSAVSQRACTRSMAKKDVQSGRCLPRGHAEDMRSA